MSRPQCISEDILCEQNIMVGTSTIVVVTRQTPFATTTALDNNYLYVHSNSECISIYIATVSVFQQNTEPDIVTLHHETQQQHHSVTYGEK